MVKMAMMKLQIARLFHLVHFDPIHYSVLGLGFEKEWEICVNKFPIFFVRLPFVFGLDKTSTVVVFNRALKWMNKRSRSIVKIKCLRVDSRERTAARDQTMEEARTGCTLG